MIIVDIEYKINPSLKIELNCEARRFGDSKISHKLDINDRLAGLLFEIFKSPDPQKMIQSYPAEFKAVLVEFGILVSDNAVPQSINLNIQIMPYENSLEEICHSNYILNPGINTSEYQMNLVKDHEVSHNLFPEAPVLWVVDPETKMKWPYKVDSEALAIINSLLVNQLSLAEIPKRYLKAFIESQILISRATQNIENIVESSDYILHKNVIPDFYKTALRDYYRKLEIHGYLTKDQFNPRRFLERDEKVTTFIHRQLAKLIRTKTNSQIFPSFCYISPYLGGADLPKHIDNDQCEWNASILIDDYQDQNSIFQWPLNLLVNGDEKNIILDPGDCIAYRGNKVPHWRDALPENCRQTLLLFHFCDINFEEDIKNKTRLGSLGIDRWS
jgi:hypothetical protein